jgi:signal transduction histidine kinase
MQRGQRADLVASERTIQSAYDPREGTRDASIASVANVAHMTSGAGGANAAVHRRAVCADRPSTVRRRSASFEAESLSTSACLAALGAATDGILLINRAGVVVYGNPAAEAFFSDTRLSGHDFADLCTLDKPTMSGIWRGLRRSGTWRGNLAGSQLHSKAPELEVTVKRVNDGGSEKFCVVLHGAGRVVEAASDATQAARPGGKRPLRGELQSALQRVASEIAHDFNNQIAVVLNYTFVLLKQMPAESPLKAHVSEMQAAAWRASQIAQAIHRSLLTHTLLPSSSE